MAGELGVNETLLNFTETVGPNFTTFYDSMNWISIGLEGTITAVLLTIISCLVISRKSHDIRVLQFPILLGWNAIGIYPGMFVILASGVIFVHATLTTELLSSMLQGTATAVTRGMGVGRDKLMEGRNKERMFKDVDEKLATGMYKKYKKKDMELESKGEFDPEIYDALRRWRGK